MPQILEDYLSFDCWNDIVLSKCFTFPMPQILEDYNENHTSMKMVLFDDALDHLTRVHRVLRMPQGHALLVGVGGSGKQSICRLAAHTAKCEVFEITLSRGYNESSMREDLKTLYQKLGQENKQMVFLFTDQHVAEEGRLPAEGVYLVPSLSLKSRMRLALILVLSFFLPLLISHFFDVFTSRLLSPIPHSFFPSPSHSPPISVIVLLFSFCPLLFSEPCLYSIAVIIGIYITPESA